MEQAEQINQNENREKDQLTRQVVIHFIRHGDTEYKKAEDLEGDLTKLGKQQAREAGERLFNDLTEGSVLAFHSSSRLRTIQTAQEISTEVVKLSQKSGKKIVFHNENPKAFSRLAVGDKATEEWLDVLLQGQNPVDYFLDNPTEATKEDKKHFNSYLSKLSFFTKRLSPQGPDVHIVAVTHTGPSEAFIQGLTGQRPEGSLTSCEEFRINLPVSNEKPNLIYKGTSSEIRNI